MRQLLNVFGKHSTGLSKTCKRNSVDGTIQKPSIIVLVRIHNHRERECERTDVVQSADYD